MFYYSIKTFFFFSLADIVSSWPTWTFSIFLLFWAFWCLLFSDFFSPFIDRSLEFKEKWCRSFKKKNVDNVFNVFCATHSNNHDVIFISSVHVGMIFLTMVVIVWFDWYLEGKKKKIHYYYTWFLDWVQTVKICRLDFFFMYFTSALASLSVKKKNPSREVGNVTRKTVNCCVAWIYGAVNIVTSCLPVLRVSFQSRGHREWRRC